MKPKPFDPSMVRMMPLPTKQWHVVEALRDGGDCVMADGDGVRIVQLDGTRVQLTLPEAIERAVAQRTPVKDDPPPREQRPLIDMARGTLLVCDPVEHFAYLRAPSRTRRRVGD